MYWTDAILHTMVKFNDACMHSVLQLCGWAGLLTTPAVFPAPDSSSLITESNRISDGPNPTPLLADTGTVKLVHVYIFFLSISRNCEVVYLPYPRSPVSTPFPFSCIVKPALKATCI